MYKQRLSDKGWIYNFAYYYSVPLKCKPEMVQNVRECVRSLRRRINMADNIRHCIPHIDEIAREFAEHFVRRIHASNRSDFLEYFLKVF